MKEEFRNDEVTLRNQSHSGPQYTVFALGERSGHAQLPAHNTAETTVQNHLAVIPTLLPILLLHVNRCCHNILVKAPAEIGSMSGLLHRTSSQRENTQTVRRGPYTVSTEWEMEMGDPRTRRDVWPLPADRPAVV